MSAVLYKEIIPYPDITVHWKDLTINAGASQSTLQDIKIPESAGCFTYNESGNLSSPCSNRFIYWRTTHDVLEFVEVSLDVNLRGNHLRLRFQHTPVLPDVSIQETSEEVVILIATVSTIHKLCLPHPRKLLGKGYLLQQTNIILPSIFFDVSQANLRDHSSCFVLNHASVGIPLPHTSCCSLAQNGDAVFILANSAGSMLLIIMTVSGKITTTELKKSSVMSRLWSGLVPSAIRGGQENSTAISIVSHQTGSDIHIFALCQDLRIRMWSYNRLECLMSASVFEYYGKTGNTSTWSVTAQQCYLRQSVDTTGPNLYLGVFVSLPQQNQFFIFQPNLTSDQYILSHISTLICSRECNLVDFCLSMSEIWTLWVNGASEPSVKVYSIESEESLFSDTESLSVALKPPNSKDVIVSLGQLDSRETYIKEIFRQGRFSPSIIARGIVIFRRAHGGKFDIDIAPDIELLKEEAIKAVEQGIQVKASEKKIHNEDAYHDLQVQCWHHFFSYCIQYQDFGNKPLGISLDPCTGCVIIVKRHIFSLLRPCDAFEQMILSKVHPFDSSVFANLSIVEYKEEDATLSLSLMGVIRCIQILSKSLTKEMERNFEQDLFYLKSPESIVEELVKELDVMPSDIDNCLLTKLGAEIRATPNIVLALEYLLKSMDIGQKAELYDLSDYDAPRSNTYRNFLCGTSGMSIICEGVSQFVKERFTFCRNLLIFEYLLKLMEEKNILGIEKSEKIMTCTVPYTSLLINAYYTIIWCTQCVCMPVQAALIESGLQQLSLLELSEGASLSKSERESAWSRTIVHLFLSELGGCHSRHLLALQPLSEESSDDNWTSLFPVLIANSVQLLWPLGPHFIFPEFLLTQCQYLALQGYVRQLEKWCKWNIHSLKFLSANSLLTLGEHARARDLFCQVIGGLDKEEFLRAKLMQGADPSAASNVAQYYMKVIQLFEYLKLSEYIISLAIIAIETLDKTDPQIPVFQSLVFKHHLELGHDDEAFLAMTHNQDYSRQKDCLRQLIVVLCERKNFDKLIKYSYAEMTDDVISILESRARSCDLMRQNYYDLLHAFHVNCNNFRKAASISYEYGMRLSQESSNFCGLKKQASCYLAAITCLRLVKPEYSWIVKPLHGTIIPDEIIGPANSSPKRNSDGDEIVSTASTKKVEVLELDDIRHEYQLIHARLLLVEKDPSPTNIAATPLSASDTVTLLVNAGLFDHAISLCKAFKLSLTPIFEGLAYRCLSVVQCAKSQPTTDDDVEILEWLGQNDTASLPTSSYIRGHEQVWYLLKNYLELHEAPGQSHFHRCIATKLFAGGIQLPAWFKRSYQCRNAAELLWLYVRHGLLENATDLAVDYIDAVLGHGKEDFQIKHALHATSPSVWLPHTYIDALLGALEEVQNEYTNCTALYRKLKEKLIAYNEAVDLASETKIMMAVC